MNYIWIVLAVFGALTVLAAFLYIPKFIQFSYFLKKPARKTATEKRRISLVIPARNESGVIGDLLDSVLTQDYDRNYFDVNVIVQDENDPTVRLAKEAGANVFVVPEQTCKSAALDGYFHALTPERRDSYDAFVIVDADAVLSPDYVTELNNALDYDCDIVLTRKNIKNFLAGRKSRSIFCNCASLIYPVLDEMGNNYRMAKGVPLNMCGQGLMVRANVIRELGGWPFRTLTEDYELRMASFLHGFTSIYYPYAVLYTEEVVRHRDAWTRRLRWTMGYSQCDHIYKKKISRKMKEEGASFAARYDCFFSLVPLILFIVAVIVTALCGVGLTVYFAVTANPLWLRSLLLLTVFPLLLMYFLEFCHLLLSMIAYRDALTALSFGEKLATMLFAPLFMFEFFPIFIHGQISLLLKKHLGWQHTERVHYAKRVSVKAFRERLQQRKRRKEGKTERETVNAE